MPRDRERERVTFRVQPRNKKFARFRLIKSGKKAQSAHAALRTLILRDPCERGRPAAARKEEHPVDESPGLN